MSRRNGLEIGAPLAYLRPLIGIPILASMASMTILVDDIDHSTDDVETIEFGIDGSSYSIDLGPENAEALRAALAVYIEHGQRVSGPPRATRKSKPAVAAPPTSAPAATPKNELATIREWARSNGYGISDRGRISQQIRDAYAAAG